MYIPEKFTKDGKANPPKVSAKGALPATYQGHFSKMVTVNLLVTRRLFSWKSTCRQS